jgi:hypothetical protein
MTAKRTTIRLQRTIMSNTPSCGKQGICDAGYKAFALRNFIFLEAFLFGIFT